MVDTLFNDRTNYQEGKSSPCIGTKSFALPEARDALLQESSQTGVSLDYVHEESKKWYVLRATYGREKKAFEHITSFGTVAYLPTIKEYRIENGENLTKEKSLIPSILFVYATSTDISRYIKGKDSLSFLRYYYNRVNKNARGKNDPLTIPTSCMDNFIHALQIEGTKTVNPQYVVFKTGDMVKVTGGICKGIVGRVGRINRQTGVMIELEGLCCLMTTYVPKVFIQKIEDSSEK